MAEEKTDYSHIYDFLYRIEKRIGYLEKDAAFIEKKIKQLDESKINNYHALNEEIARLHLGTRDLKDQFNQCITRMSGLGKDLRNTVKKEEIQTLNGQVDELQFEDYVTEKDLIRGV